MIEHRLSQLPSLKSINSNCNKCKTVRTQRTACNFVAYFIGILHFSFLRALYSVQAHYAIFVTCRNDSCIPIPSAPEISIRQRSKSGVRTSPEHVRVALFRRVSRHVERLLYERRRSLVCAFALASHSRKANIEREGSIKQERQRMNRAL